MRATRDVVLSAGELWRALVELPIEIDGFETDIGFVDVAGYYDGQPRPTGVVRLRGREYAGEGENVDWYLEDQRAFAEACSGCIRIGRTTVGDLSGGLVGLDSPYHRAAVEAAAIDLALRQAGTSMVRLSGRPSHPIHFCWSLGVDAYDRYGQPLAAIERLLDSAPEARLKIDVPAERWPDDVWRRLAERGRVVVLDFKRSGSVSAVAQAHESLPNAWIEDPPVDALLDGSPWVDRIALDGYVTCEADLRTHPSVTAAVNIKAPRMGGTLEVLRCIEACHRSGWHAYFGGMFEVGPGRRQARILASLFAASAWNDLAPLRSRDDEAYADSPAAITAPESGFSS